jgi:two-component system response regulator HydG/two-component system response regulator AtoC
MQRKEDIANVLIADNDPGLARLMLEILARKGIRGHLVGDKQSALDFVNKGHCDLLIAGEIIETQQNGEGKGHDGFELLSEVRANWPELPVVMIARNQNGDSKDNGHLVETAVRAIRQGCRDFLVRPPDRRRVEFLLDTFLPNHDIEIATAAHEDTHCLFRIVGRSASLNQAVSLAKRIAPTSAPVLISGESGTGKELMAYLIHQKSRRAQGSYIRINCAALSESLLESELFGHEKGAFTGAYTQRKGRFEMAHGGTLLLDEITETPIRFQAKLLRVLEQQDFERVGGNERVRVDVRIISTTNKDLLHEVQKGRFRADLYYRLSGTRLILSPLKERKDDLPDLVWYFVNLYAREVQRHITRLDPAMMDIFSNYHWPGNVRQLRNVVRTSLILGAGSTLALADVSWLFDELQPLEQQECGPDVASLAGLPLEQIERRAILDTLRQTGGNRTRAAKVLGISDRTLRDKIHRYRRQGALQPA